MDTLSGFVLEHRLGEGSMGEVWRARAPDGIAVAIKVARARVLHEPRLMRLVEGEVRAMARLDHPHIPWVYDHGRVPEGGPFEPGAPYMVLEHCGAGTLASRRLTCWEAVAELAAQLLDALGHAHARGIVHRDLKPANVLWAGSDDVRPGPKLADFGIAFAVGLDGGSTSVAGTPWYMAPEQAQKGEALGPWTDLYSLGVVLWEQITGQPPYWAADVLQVLAAARSGRLPPFVPRFEVPDATLPWLKGLLARQPRERFRRAADAWRALSAFEPRVKAPGAGWRGGPSEGLPRLRLQGAGLGLLPLREIELTGREAERDLLWHVLFRVRKTRMPEVVLLRGVSGIGKTRLATWLARRAAELGLAESLSVPCRGQAPLLGLLAGMLRLQGSASALRQKIPEALTQQGLAEPAVDRLTELLQGPISRWGSVPAVRKALFQLAHEPWIVLLDDAHASESAIRLARALLAERLSVRGQQEPAPLLLVLSVEEDALAGSQLRDLVDGLQQVPGVTAVALGPLPGPEQDKLVDTLIGLDPEAQSALLASAAGHPGYLVARVTDWVRQGRLRPTPRGFGLTRPLGAEASAAPSLASLWERRLDELLSGLDEPSILLLERAAALGREVDEELWEGACDDPSADLAETGQLLVDPAAARARIALVDRLIRSGVAHETEVGFTFAHPALVDALLQRARAGGRTMAHHRACAAQLRRRPMPQHALALGSQLARAGDWSAAVDALVEGIDWAWMRADRRPLLAEVERAERCADQARLPEDDRRRIRLHLLRGVLLLGLARMDEAEVCVQTALALAERIGDRALIAQATMRMCDIVPLRGDWQGAAPWFERFLQVEDAAAKPHWGGLVRARLGSVAAARGEPALAERWYGEAEAILLSCDQGQPQVAGALLELYGLRFNDERALRFSDQAERVAAEEGLLADQAYVLFRRHEILRKLGRYEEADAAIRSAIALADQMGDTRAAVVYRGQLAICALAQERPLDAHATLEDALARVGALDNVWMEGMLSLLDLQALLGLGRLEELDRRLQRMGELAPRVPRSERQIEEALRDLAGQLRALGEHQRAARLEELAALAHSAC